VRRKKRDMSTGLDHPRAMKRKTRHQTARSVASRRWAAYVSAGAASAFTCAHSAQAAIHYSGPINHWVGNFASFRLQLDQSGNSFRLRHQSAFYGTDGYGGTAHFGIIGRANAAFAGRYNTCPGNSSIASVSNLRRGDPISTRPFLHRHSGILAANSFSNCGSNYVGQFDQGKLGYVGFKFNSGSGDQYGWVRIKMGPGIDHTVRVIDYAYGDVGDQIRAGQASSSQAPSLESLGGLALGAVGLLAWRKYHPRRQPAR
jgi:hypothetical protein